MMDGKKATEGGYGSRTPLARPGPLGFVSFFGNQFLVCPICGWCEAISPLLDAGDLVKVWTEKNAAHRECLQAWRER